MSKPALLVVNKMDLPEASEKLAELKTQLQNPEGSSLVDFSYVCKVIVSYSTFLPPGRVL